MRLSERQMVAKVGKLLPPIEDKKGRLQKLQEIYLAISAKHPKVKFPTFRNQVLGNSRMSYEIGMPLETWLLQQDEEKETKATTTDKAN